MATLLFKLTNVPFDEANDIRELLAENKIEYYETDSGFFRIGLDAIWLQNKEDFEQAKKLIDNYQAQRSQQQRETYIQQKEQGEALNLWQKFLTQPIRFIATMIAVVLILALTLLPFLLL
jgi:Family of unknown function (DUF6164)